MLNIPPEFACYNYYLEAAQQFQSRFPDIADVLNKCFSDSCQDLVDEGQASPEAQQFLAEFNDNHSNPPDEAVQHVRQVADQFYRILTKQYNAGKFTPTLEKQLGLTSILYSVLDGQDADERCQQCKDLRKSVQDMLLLGSASGSVPTPQAPTAPAPAPAAPATPSPAGSVGGPPVFTPPAVAPSNPAIPNQSGSNVGPPVFTPPSASHTMPSPAGSSGGPPVFTPQSSSPTMPSPAGSSGGPPVFTPPSGYPSVPQPPSFGAGPPSFTPSNAATTTITSGNVPSPQFNQTYNNMPQQQQQNSINIPSSAVSSPPPYGSFPPTAQNPQQLQQQNFDAQGAMSFLNSLGYTMISSSVFPPLNNSTYPVIQTYLDYAISSLKNNDTAQSLAFLQNAFKIWSTGSQ